jgi:cathepsin L
MGINQFTALTDAEFYLSYLSPLAEAGQVSDEIGMVGAEIDWTAKGVVSPIKNEGQCHASWAFSATAACESLSWIKGQKVILSEQQLIDCSGSYGNYGCLTGSSARGLSFVKDRGLSTESEYPYVGKNQTCKRDGGNYKITNITSASGCAEIETGLGC